MPNGKTFKVKDKQTGKTFTVREKQPFQFGGGMPPTAPTGAGGEFQVSPFQQKLTGIQRGVQRGLPAIGQVAGGLAGFPVGAMFGHPYLGSAIGGTIGRAVGRLEQMTADKQQAQPHKTQIATMMGPAIRYTTLYNMLEPEQKIDFGKELFKTGAIEAVAAPIGLGITKLGAHLGRGALKGLLTPRVAERGIQHGWKNVLRPEFFKGRIPKAIGTKMHSFFDKLTKVSGQGVDDLVNVKYGKVLKNISGIKKNIRTLLPKSGRAEDLLEITASKAQKNLLNEITDEIIGLKGNTRRVSSLWALRKKIDKAIYGRSWTPDASRYLRGVRRALNAPIKELGDDVTEAFGRYSFVKQAEDDLGKKFAGITGPKGEIYSARLESYVGNLLSSKKDDQIRMLVDLDSILGADDKIIESLLNYAASEAIQGEIMGIGVVQRFLIGVLGGRRTIAQMGRTIQAPVTQWGKRIIGRGIPTTISESVKSIAAEELKR